MRSSGTACQCRHTVDKLTDESEVNVRYGVEFLELDCKGTRNSSEDVVALNFGDSTLWSGRIRSKTRAPIETIKPISGDSGIVRLWHTEAGSRTVSCLGRHTIRLADDDGPEATTASFTRDGAQYTLSYKLFQIPD